MISINSSGRFEFNNNRASRSVTHGRALELAQLVVENPGRIPLTIHSPGLSFSGHGKNNHTSIPRMFEADESFGLDSAVKDTVFRLEPYDRVTFLFDYRSVIPEIIKDAPKGRVAIRGCVSVAGHTKRTKKPQRSNLRRRWVIHRGMYTAITGSPKFTPFSVLWRKLYNYLPTLPSDADLNRNTGDFRLLTQNDLTHVLNLAMSRFTERPKLEKLREEFTEVAKEFKCETLYIDFYLYDAYELLDRMEGNLTSWTDGLFYRAWRKKDENGSQDI